MEEKSNETKTVSLDSAYTTYPKSKIACTFLGPIAEYAGLMMSFAGMLAGDMEQVINGGVVYLTGKELPKYVDYNIERKRFKQLEERIGGCLKSSK